VLKRVALITLFVALASAGRAQTLPETGSFAIVDAKVEIGDGRTLDKATIIIRDGQIQAVGKDLKIPADAEVVKGTGLVAYPGFIDAACTRGLKLPDPAPDQDLPPDTTSLAPASMREANRKWIRPELLARDFLALTDADLAPMRRNGFCAALLVPTGGLITGVSTVVDLSGMPRRDVVLNGAVGMCMGFSPADAAAAGPRQPGAGGGGGYPGSLMGIIAHLRQTLIDADGHRKQVAQYARSSVARPPFDDALDALDPALTGAMPVLFSADSKNEIVRALRLADEFHLKLVVSGGGEAWKMAPELAKRGIPVLASVAYGDEPGVARPAFGGAGGAARPGGGRFGRPGGGRRGQGAQPGGQPPATADTPPVLQDIADVSQTPPAAAPGEAATGAAAQREADDTPAEVTAEQHKKWEERIACAARLESAGVPFAFTTAGLRSPTEFWRALRQTIAAGLPKQAALRALTINPARILGVERQIGTIEAGKLANIVLMSGDFSDAASQVKLLFIDKNKFDPSIETATPAAPAAAAPADDDLAQGGEEDRP